MYVDAGWVGYLVGTYPFSRSSSLDGNEEALLFLVSKGSRHVISQLLLVNGASLSVLLAPYRGRSDLHTPT